MGAVPWTLSSNLVEDGLSMHVTNQSAAQLAAPGEDLTRDIQELQNSAFVGWPGGIEALWVGVENVASGLLTATSKVLLEPVGEFRPESTVLVPKILGLDVLLSADAEGQPARAWLLEVNRHPSLGEKYACARRVKRQVTLDAWKLLWHAGSSKGSHGSQVDTLLWPNSHGCLHRIDGALGSCS